MTQHIIDTDELEKLPRYEQDKFLVQYEDVVKLIANSPQADGMVLVPIEPTEEMIEAGDKVAVIHYEYGENLFIENTDEVYKAMLSAYKPQADDVRKDAERWRYLKDKYAMVNFDIYDAEMGETKVTGIIFEMPSGIRYSADINATIDQAIDKARE